MPDLSGSRVGRWARRAAHRWVRRLPAPRDRAALDLLRDARSLVSGAEPPTPPPAPTPARRRRPAPTGAARRARRSPERKRSVDGLPGRWIRVVAPPSSDERVVDAEGTDPTEAAAVRAGWLLVDVHERLSPLGARRVLGHETEAWMDYTRQSLVKLEHPEGGNLSDYESMTNLLRCRRTMDFVGAGDRVFDVGFGRGYLAAQLVQNCGIESYHGIDVIPQLLPSSLRLFAANDMVDAPIHLEMGDLFDLTRERLEATGTTVVICCEVLEHVDDPEQALRTLADALPDGADLVFSVPLHGRLEAVWGHVTVFDVARLKDMLEEAGLVAHHVEPLANTWTLLVASRDPGASRRVREAHRRPAVRSSRPLTAHRDFVDLPVLEAAPVGPTTGLEVVDDEAGRTWVSCRVTDRGGVGYPVDGLEALRLHLDLKDIEQVRRFVVTAHAGRRRIGRWTWRPGPGQVLTGIRKFALRPGEQGTSFASDDHHRLGRADRIEVKAVTRPGRSASFGVRGAYLP